MRKREKERGVTEREGYMCARMRVYVCANRWLDGWINGTGEIIKRG